MMTMRERTLERRSRGRAVAERLVRVGRPRDRCARPSIPFAAAPCAVRGSRSNCCRRSGDGGCAEKRAWGTAAPSMWPRATGVPRRTDASRIRASQLVATCRGEARRFASADGEIPRFRCPRRHLGDRRSLVSSPGGSPGNPRVLTAFAGFLHVLDWRRGSAALLHGARGIAPGVLVNSILFDRDQQLENDLWTRRGGRAGRGAVSRRPPRPPHVPGRRAHG
jgi:hypothetical protein